MIKDPCQAFFLFVLHCNVSLSLLVPETQQKAREHLPNAQGHPLLDVVTRTGLQWEGLLSPQNLDFPALFVKIVFTRANSEGESPQWGHTQQ